MKLLLTVLAFMFVVNAQAATTPKPVHSIHDLPQRWEGIAGDLVTRVPAVFEIYKVKKVVREETGNRLNATYEVYGVFSLGNRSVEVKEVQLSAADKSGRLLEIVIRTEDALVPAVLAAIRYDEATNTYVLKDYPNSQGERRFSLSSAAR